jgi:hypothetical protein
LGPNWVIPTAIYGVFWPITRHIWGSLPANCVSPKCKTSPQSGNDDAQKSSRSDRSNTSHTPDTPTSEPPSECNHPPRSSKNRNKGTSPPPSTRSSSRIPGNLPDVGEKPPGRLHGPYLSLPLGSPLPALSPKSPIIGRNEPKRNLRLARRFLFGSCL